MSDSADGGESDEGDESEEAPPVELGEGPDVEGAPVGRIAARFQWGTELSEVDRREGDTEIRTPDGPQALGDVLDEIETTYFASRQEFVTSVRDVIGTGPVPTAED